MAICNVNLECKIKTDSTIVSTMGKNSVYECIATYKRGLNSYEDVILHYNVSTIGMKLEKDACYNLKGILRSYGVETSTNHSYLRNYVNVKEVTLLETTVLEEMTLNQIEFKDCRVCKGPLQRKSNSETNPIDISWLVLEVKEKQDFVYYLNVSGWNKLAKAMLRINKGDLLSGTGALYTRYNSKGNLMTEIDLTKFVVEEVNE